MTAQIPFRRVHLSTETRQLLDLVSIDCKQDREPEHVSALKSHDNEHHPANGIGNSDQMQINRQGQGGNEENAFNNQGLDTKPETPANAYQRDSNYARHQYSAPSLKKRTSSCLINPDSGYFFEAIPTFHVIFCVGNDGDSIGPGYETEVGPCKFR